MSNLLREWNRLAFSKGSRIMNESGPDYDQRLNPLKELGFYFAGADTVVLGDLDSMSGKEYKHRYPYFEHMGQGPFHVQISVEKDGTFRVHNYSEVDDAYCTGTMPTGKIVFNTIEEVIEQVHNMIKCYDEWMDAYCQIRDAGGTIDVEESYAPAYINDDHPAAQALRKK